MQTQEVCGTRQIRTERYLSAPPLRWIAAVVLILILALFMRLWPLPGEALEGDEVFSKNMASLPVSKALEAIHSDLVHPPLYYLALKSVTAVVGSTDNGVRALSLLAGILMVILTAGFGLLTPALRVPAQICAFLVAINDLQIFFSQQARSYELYSLVITVLLLLFVAAEQYKRRFLFWFAVVSVSSALLYIHYVGVIYIAALLGSAIICTTGWKGKLRWILCFAASGLAFAPWALTILLGPYHERGLAANLAWESPASLYNLKAMYGRFSGIPDIPAGTTLSVVVAGLLVCAACWWAARTKDETEKRIIIGCAAIGILPPLCLHLLSIPPLQLPLTGYRHLVPSQMPWAMLTVCGLWAVRHSLPRYSTAIGYAGVTALVLLQAVPAVHSSLHPRRIPYHEVAHDIERLPAITHIYTTYEYGVGQPVRHYLHNRQQVAGLPLTAAELPATFVLLYRPANSNESRRAQSLKAAGWHELDSHYYPADHSNAFGTQMQVMTRTDTAHFGQ
jgi:hypothetical protein